MADDLRSIYDASFKENSAEFTAKRSGKTCNKIQDRKVLTLEVMDYVICLHCSSPSRRYFTSNTQNYYHCSKCGIVWRHPIPSDAELNEIYHKAYSQKNIEQGATNQESGDYAIIAYLNYIVNNFTLSGKKILDYGAATGLLVSKLRSLGQDCDGYEFSSAAQKYSRQEHGISLFDSPEAIPANCYQLVTMIEVIEHLRSPGSVLRSIHAYLRPGGTLLLTTPNRRGWRALLKGPDWVEAAKPFHLYLFDESSLKRLLANSGFSDISRVGFSPITRPGFIRRLWGRTMQLFGLGGTLCLIARRKD